MHHSPIIPIQPTDGLKWSMSAISQGWRKSDLQAPIAHAIKVGYQSVENFALRVRIAHWRLISTAPCNQELELRIVENEKVLKLEFPCLQISAGVWINVDLGSEIKIQPIQWRVWQGTKSPQPHRTRIKPRRIYVRTRMSLWGQEQTAVVMPSDFDVQSHGGQDLWTQDRGLITTAL